MRKVMYCLVLALLTAGMAATAPAAQSGEIPWPLAVRIMSYGKYQDSAWAHLKEIGVRYIFLAVPAPADVEATQAKLKEFGLTAIVLRGNTDLAKEGCVEELAGQLAICQKMGVKFMFLSAKLNGADKGVVLERLRKAGDIAQRLGIAITLETHPELGTNGDVQLETMKALNHTNVRVNFDTANITYYNKNTDAVTELKKSIDFVGTMEFKDHTGEFETWNFPVLGKGRVNFPEIVKIMKEHHYAGPVTLEFEGVKGVELSEADTKQAIAESVAYVRALGVFK